MTKFNIDDTVYLATCRNEEIKVPCPVCYGKLEVVLILGNDDKVTLSCDYCGKGYDGPKGYTREYKFIVAAKPVTITGVDSEKRADGEKIQYRSGCYVYAEDQLFIKEEDALEKAKEVKAANDEEQNTRAKYIKHNVNKSFSWNAGYHFRCAKREREQAEYHEKKAALCKARQQ